MEPIPVRTATVESRQAVVAELAFLHDVARQDLLDPGTTDDRVIFFLEDLLNARGGAWKNKQLIITAVRSDHPTYDGPNGHAGGRAVDLSQNGADNAPLHLVRDIQACMDARGIGLGGPFQGAAMACGGYNAASKLFQDNGTDHIHVQVAGY